MRAQTITDVIPIFVAPALSMLKHNKIGVTYAGTSNFKMQLVRSIQLYFVAMPQSIIIVTETPFVSTLIHNIVGIESIPQTPRGTQLVSMHEDMPREVNKFFVNQPSNQ